jgi:hypothetical protein
MIKRFSLFILFLIIVSCAPTSWLSMDIINPAEFTFPDSGKIVILNATYLPTVIQEKNNLIPKLPLKEKFIFDTLITANIFNGFFSVTNESPNRYLQAADYEEIRTSDTSNFLNPISSEGIEYLCQNYNARYLITLEYFGFNKKESKDPYYDEGWLSFLQVSRHLLWRIYQKDGTIIDQYADVDTLNWVDDSYDTDFGPIPELPDATREAFFLAGEKYGQRISPFWSVLARQYYLISRAGEDISLDRDRLVDLISIDKQNLAYRCCYNLAIISESEDKLSEAITWLDSAQTFKSSEEEEYYRKKLEKRIITRDIIDMQSGFY